MKKLIALTSILAAGTLAANAAFNTTAFTVGGKTYTLDSWSSETLNSNLSDGTLESSNSLILPDTTSSLNQSWVLSFTFSVLPTSTTDGSLAIISMDSTSDPKASGYTLKYTSQTNLAGKVQLWIGTGDTDYTKAVVETVPINQEVSFGYIAVSENSGFMFVATGGKVVTTDLWTGRGDNVILDSDSRIWTNNKAIQYKNISLLSAGLATIPEPSMFGLLAGTLALGLAGTRRRRRAK